MEQNKINLIPNKETAVKLAEIYVENVYGKETANRQKPYTVENIDGVWIVSGKPPKALGGKFRVAISEKDGKVIEISHSK